ncbi:MAG: nuclear transport factor 2 family protein [Thermaerobacter sp.]|nr:nuclear transport factor 2 family protein [Thermaerobacter sp.]
MDVQQTLRQYEQAANSRDFDHVAPMVADHAVYWFSDGEFEGLDAIRGAFEMTWNTIEQERYAIEDVQWVVVGDQAAVCIYQFRSEGVVRGRPFLAVGRGTNVFALIDGR